MSDALLGCSVDQLKHLLAEHNDHRPADLFSAEGKAWAEKAGKIRFHLELAEGAERIAWKDAPGPAHQQALAPSSEDFRLPDPVASPRKPAPVATPEEETDPFGGETNPPVCATEPSISATPPATPEARQEAGPDEPMAPAASQPAEPAMKPKSDPKSKLEHLLAEMRKAQKKGKRPYDFQFRIRKLCEEEGLEIPEEARKGQGKGPRQAPKPQPKKASSRPPEAIPLPPGLVVSTADELSDAINRAGEKTTASLRRMLGVGAGSIAKQLSGVASQFRALRTQAIELLPYCEDLTTEDAGEVRHQIDLLAGVLAMGDRLAQEAR